MDGSGKQVRTGENRGGNACELDIPLLRTATDNVCKYKMDGRYLKERCDFKLNRHLIVWWAKTERLYFVPDYGTYLDFMAPIVKAWDDDPYRGDYILSLLGLGLYGEMLTNAGKQALVSFDQETGKVRHKQFEFPAGCEHFDFFETPHVEVTS